MSRLPILALAALAAAGANASTVSLSGPASVTAGDEFVVSISGDFTEVTLGGGFDVSWDDTLIEFVSSQVTAPGSDPSFTRDGDPSPGLLNGIGFGDINGYNGIVAIADVTLRALSAEGLQSTSINLGPNVLPAGPLVDEFGDPLSVTYNGLSVDIDTAVADTDNDGVLDDVDNCLEVENAGQLDSDSDGFGNACDGDLDNNCFTNFTDLGLFGDAFGSPGDNPADFDGSGFVNFDDLGIFGSLFGTPPGPAATECVPQ